MFIDFDPNIKLQSIVVWSNEPLGYYVSSDMNYYLHKVGDKSASKVFFSNKNFLIQNIGHIM